MNTFSFCMKIIISIFTNVAREFGQFPAPVNPAKIFSSLIHLPYQIIRAKLTLSKSQNLAKWNPYKKIRANYNPTKKSRACATLPFGTRATHANLLNSALINPKIRV